jgi:hypothetical protein
MLLFPSASRAPGTYTREFQPALLARNTGCKGIVCSINYTAEGSGSATLDFKLQYRDGDAWKDLTGASVAQMTGVADTDLLVYPGRTAVANRVVDLPLFEAMRAVAVVGTAAVTFSVAMDALP